MARIRHIVLTERLRVCIYCAKGNLARDFFFGWKKKFQKQDNKIERNQQCRYARSHFCLPPTKLWEGNDFTAVNASYWNAFLLYFEIVFAQ